MKIYRHEGNIWDYPNASGSTIVAGQGVVIGTVVGIAVSDIADGETGAVRVKGVVEFAKPSGENISQGVALNFDETNQEFQLAAGDLTGAGTASMAAGSGTTTVMVALNPATA